MRVKLGGSATLGLLLLAAVFGGFASIEYKPQSLVPLVHALGPKTVTSHGAVIDNSQSRFGGASAYFAPSAYVAVADHPDFAFGTGDFTIDFWIKWKTLPSSAQGWNVNFYSQATDPQNYDLWQVNPWNTPTYTYQFYVNTAGVARPATNWQPSIGISAGTWYHMALVRSGESWYLFQNGVQCGSTITSSGSVPDYAGDVLISGFLGAGSAIDAWYDEFRISNVARWTTGFTPPTSAYMSDANTVLLIHFDSDFSDSSTTSAIDIGNKDTTYNRLNTGYLYAQKFTAPSSNPTSGPLQSITFRAGENGLVTVALYSSDSNADVPLHPLTSPQTVTVSGVAYGTPKWVTVMMTAGNQVQINQLTDYWIVFAFQTNYGVCYSGSGGYRAWKGSLSDPWAYGTAFPDPWGSSTGMDTNYQAEVYFTYAATQTGTITQTTSACSLSLPATVYRGTKWDWVINTGDACTQFQQSQGDVQTLYPWPDMVAQWLVNKLGAPEYMSQRMTLELIAGSGIGGYSSPTGIGLTIGMFTIVRNGVKGGYAYQLIAHEMTNNYMTTAGGDYPPDWWADTVSPYPAATTNLLEIDLNWGNSRAVGNAEVNSCHQNPPVDPIACPLINMFYDQLYGQYGTGMFANAFAAMRSDGIWFRDVGGPIGTVSALRTNYVAAYLFIGASTDLSSILSDRVPNFDRQTTLNIEQARTSLQSIPRTDNRWYEYLHGNYAAALTVTTTASTASTSTTTAPSTTSQAASGVEGVVYWRDGYGNLHLLSWAQVSAVSETGLTAVTGTSDGSYVLLVVPGTYTVSAESGPAFLPQSEVVTVSPGRILLVDFVLACATCSTTTTQTQSTITGRTTVIETSTVTSTTASTLVTSGSTRGLQMQVVSNSTVTSLTFDSTRRILSFTVSGPSGSRGFFDVTIAKSLLSEHPIVLVDGMQTPASVTQDAYFWYIHVTYSHSVHQVTIGGSNVIQTTSTASSQSSSTSTTSSLTSTSSVITTATTSSITGFTANLALTATSGMIGTAVTARGSGYKGTMCTLFSSPSGLISSNSACSISGGVLTGGFTVAAGASGTYTVTVATDVQGETASAIFTASTFAVSTSQQTPAATPSGPNCVIATAAYGSAMAADVVHMRYVRDQLIGSTPTGKILVNAFDTFYYTWSPMVAQAIVENEFLRAVFRVLLLPILGAVNVAGLTFTFVVWAAGSKDVASVVAFLVAASFSVAIYLAMPAFLIRKCVRAIRERRPLSLA